MKVDRAEFDFTFQGKKYHAYLSMFQPQKKPMVRVAVLPVEKKQVAPISMGRAKKERIPVPEVFIFWKTNPDELFWFDLHDKRKQTMAKFLADMLLK